MCLQGSHGHSAAGKSLMCQLLVDGANIEMSLPLLSRKAFMQMKDWLQAPTHFFNVTLLS